MAQDNQRELAAIVIQDQKSDFPISGQKEKLVLTPQPELNPNQQLNQEWLFLPKLFIDEVAGIAFLLLKIKKNKTRVNFEVLLSTAEQALQRE